jgi:hypothetical protein
MSVSACPVAIVNAPIEKVWSFLSEPANYALWWDAKTRSIVPEGHAHAGQTIRAGGYGLNFTLLVNGVDESKRQIHLTAIFPLGIAVRSHIACAPLENRTCQVSFG